MALNLDKTIQSALTRSRSRTLAKYTNNNNMPTVHARTWTNEKTARREDRPTGVKEDVIYGSI